MLYYQADRKLSLLLDNMIALIFTDKLINIKTRLIYDTDY